MISPIDKNIICQGYSYGILKPNVEKYIKNIHKIDKKKTESCECSKHVNLVLRKISIKYCIKLDD